MSCKKYMLSRKPKYSKNRGVFCHLANDNIASSDVISSIESIFVSF